MASIRRRQATVTAVAPAANTCTIQLAGDTTVDLAGYAFLGAYLPRVGDSVWVDQLGDTDWLVVGAQDPAGADSRILDSKFRSTNLAFTTEQTAVTSAAVTFWLDHSYRLSIAWWGVRTTAGGAAGDVAELRIKEGSTIWRKHAVKLQSAANAGEQGGSNHRVLKCVSSPAADDEIGSGTHTFTFTAARISGAGSWQLDAASDSPAELVVEDLGTSP